MAAHDFAVRTTSAGPFVTVLTLSGSLENGAKEQLHASLSALETKRVVVDLTEASVPDSRPLYQLVDETSRFEHAGGRLLVVSGRSAAVEQLLEGERLSGLRWLGSLDDAIFELLGDAVDRGAADGT
jgi:anti-anti-sigma regulatory factor